MQFRTKARAVELLGKGQIADLPTAITELWKNGYDAYADDLSLVYYTEGYEDVNTDFVVLSDDGKGMNRKDIEDKWLILGTDSKSRNKKPEKGVETLWKETRPIMGEKGIGRLSVSYLGSPMLMLSKKIGSPIQALFFDWRILENYNLFLSEVTIPITHIDSIDSFRNSFKILQQDFLANLISKDADAQKEIDIKWSDQIELKESIIEDVKSIKLNGFLKMRLFKVC
ncbi:ATP-binding protein [Algoriphagus halophilus]|uniref:ATP-binding protein n=1 Tax=Algoriphagus halophilus TaxID=226505 RepID=UPI00358F9E32